MKSEKQVKQVALGNVDQLAGRDIQNTHVHVAVNLNGTSNPEPWCLEIECHKRFKKEIGIECSPPARHELSRLLTGHNFTPRQLRIAWRNSTLKYDDDLRSLVSLPSRTEAGFGVLFFMVGILMVAPLVIKFVLSPENSAFLPVFTLYVVMLGVLGNQFVAPYRIGRRLERVLKSEKIGENRAKLC